jgi:hypothetical protein
LRPFINRYDVNIYFVVNILFIEYIPRKGFSAKFNGAYLHIGIRSHYLFARSRTVYLKSKSLSLEPTVLSRSRYIKSRATQNSESKKGCLKQEETSSLEITALGLVYH